MKKTFVTNLPDESGAFLKASECFYNLGINIVRVSYNKAVDTHTLFIEVDADESLIKKATIELEKIGYIAKLNNESDVILIDVKLDDMTGDLVKMLKLINEYNFNISYIDTHEKNKTMQHVVEKLGFKRCGIIYIEDGTPRIAYQLPDTT